MDTIAWSRRAHPMLTGRFVYNFFIVHRTIFTSLGRFRAYNETCNPIAWEQDGKRMWHIAGINLSKLLLADLESVLQ